MHKQSHNIKKSEESEDAVKLHTKIKETWTELSDDNIRLYDANPNQFFIALQKKHNVSREEAQKKLQQLEKDCCCSTKAA
jgi:hypothetical protein